MTSFDLAGWGGSSRHADLSLERLDEYYRGAQPLSYLHPDVTSQVNGRLRSLVINVPRLVVDSIEDRLDVEGFRLGRDEVADAELWRIWQANDLDEWSQQAHLDALIFGLSFVLVWPGEDPELPRITVESALQMKVTYSPGTRTVVRAVKQWREDDVLYRTVYGPDTITRSAAEAATGQYKLREQPIPNVFGVVPVVPFVNRPTLRRFDGESEMTDVIPLSDAINKLATDMMVTAEYMAMPRRWATGMDLGGNQDEADRTAAMVKQRWEEAPGQKVWLGGPGAQFGQFTEANLSNYVQALDAMTARAAALSGLPPHYFGQAGENPASADALRSSEAPLVKKVLRKQRVFGGSWERVMRLALLIRDGSVPANTLSMETIWRSAETPTVAQKMDAAVKAVAAGIYDVTLAQQELGLTPGQMADFQRRLDAAALGPVKAQIAEADRLQSVDGLSKQAAYAAVGLTQAAQAMAAAPRQVIERDPAGNITAITGGK